TRITEYPDGSCFNRQWFGSWPAASCQLQLSVNRLALYRAEGIKQAFRDRWMRVDRKHHIFYRSFQLKGRHRFGDQLSRHGSNDVNAQDLAKFGVRHNLDKALMVVDDGGLGVGGERELADLHLVSGFFGLGFCETHAADLRLTVSAAGDAVL